MWLFTLEGCEDSEMQQRDFSWWCGISMPRLLKGSEAWSAHRCYISQKHGYHHDSETSLQAVVTNDQFLAAQFKWSRTRSLLELVMRWERKKDRAWESGAKVTPEGYNYLWTRTDLHRHRLVLSLGCQLLRRSCDWLQCAYTSAVQSRLSHCENLSRLLLSGELAVCLLGSRKYEKFA